MAATRMRHRRTRPRWTPQGSRSRPATIRRTWPGSTGWRSVPLYGPRPEHAELAAAEAAGLPVVPWQALLGELQASAGHVGLAVTGTHGKSTTTALLGHLLIAAGLDPTVEVGAFIEAWGATVRPGGGAPFVVEADEFGDNFLHYHPAGVIVTNIEMDHPDYFADRAAVLDSFERFVRGMGESSALGGRLLLVTAADPGTRELRDRLAGWEGRIVGYGPGGEIAATDVALLPDVTRFTLFGERFETSLAGAHNVLNATAALALARELGAPAAALVEGLRTFPGAGRRMELIADTAGVRVYDDYGHHPTEVRAALAAARQKVGDRRLWAVFEPHMFSRTALFADAFSHAFTGCRRGRDRGHLRQPRHCGGDARHQRGGPGGCHRARNRHSRHCNRGRRRHHHLRRGAPARGRRGAGHGCRQVVPDRAAAWPRSLPAASWRGSDRSARWTEKPDGGAGRPPRRSSWQ